MTEIGMTRKLRKELFDMMNLYSNLKTKDIHFAGENETLKKKDIINILNNIEYDGSEFSK